MEHISPMNEKIMAGKKTKKNSGRLYPPCPLGLFCIMNLWADYNTGLFQATAKEMAAEFNCDRQTIKRVLRPLLKHKYIIRLFPKKPLFFIPKYAVSVKKELFKLGLEHREDGSYSIHILNHNGSYLTHVLTVYGSYLTHSLRVDSPMGHIRPITLLQIPKNKRLGAPYNKRVLESKHRSKHKNLESKSKSKSESMELNTRGESLRGGQGGSTVSRRSVSMNQEKKEILTQIKTYHRAFEKKVLAKLGGIMGQWKNWGLSNASESRTHRGQNPVAAYLDLFRTEGMVEQLGKLSPTKELRLLESLSEIALGKAKFNGQPMTCSIADFLEAIQEVNKRGLRRPITNHNYLKQVVLTHNYSTKKRAPRIMRYGKKTSTTRRKGWYQ